MEKLEPLDGVEWEEVADGIWHCGIYRYRFDFEAIIRLGKDGRYAWATRLVTDASGESECEESGTYASLGRASKKIQAIFYDLMMLPSLQGEMPC